MLTHRTHEIDKADPFFEIRNIWVMRLNRQHNQVLVQYHKISQKYLAGQDYFTSLAAVKACKNKIGKKAIALLLGLQCALLRRSAKREESSRLLKLFEDYLIDAGSVENYFYHYELSQRYLEDGNFSTALFHSRKMDQLSDEPLFALVASIHCLICLENLGMPTESLEEDIRHSLTQCPPVIVVDQQWRAFLSRKYFRSYDLKRYFQMQVSASPGQETFHRAWVLELPYLAEGFAVGLNPTLEKCLLRDEAPSGFSKYEINTLLGRQDTAESPSKLTQKCDRLYLWTWKWVVHREKYPIEAVLITLQDVLETLTTQELTIEDQFLLANSLLWLALLSNGQRGRWAALAQQFAPKRDDCCDIFSLERHILKYLMAKKDRDSEMMRKHRDLVQQKVHGRANLGSFSLLALVEGCEPLSEFINAKIWQLKESLISNEQKTEFFKDSLVSAALHKDQDLRLDLATGLVFRSGERQLRSPQLTRALNFLSRQGTRINFDEFARVAFGPRSLSASNLRSRVHTLLSKIRVLTNNEIEIRLVGQVIVIEGPWPKMEFVSNKEAPFQTPERLNSIVSSFLGQHSDRRKMRVESAVRQEIYQLLSNQPGMTRQQLQKKLGLPKTSLLRILKREIETGMIRVQKGSHIAGKVIYCSAV